MRLKSVLPYSLALLLTTSIVALAGGVEGNDIIKNPKKQLAIPNLSCLNKTKRVIVPAVQVKFLWTGDAAAGAKTGGFGRVSVKAKYVLSGLEKADCQAMAKSIYDDCVKKLRDAGWEVLTYDDVKADLADIERWKGKEGEEMPTEKNRNGDEIFAIAAPSDEMTFEPPAFQAPVWPFRRIAKEKDANIFYPVFTVHCPRPHAKATEGISESTAELGIMPFLAFTPNDMMFYFMNSKAAMGVIASKDWFRITEHAGEPVSVSSDSPEFKGKVSWFYKNVVAGDNDTGSLKSKSRFIAFRVDKPAYTEAVLKGAAAFNDVAVRLTAAEIK